MPIDPIRNDDDHRAALVRIDALWNSARGSDEEAEMDALATLVERYERDRWPKTPVEPLAALRFCMEQNSLKQVDLAALLGSKSRASEILSGRRAMTLEQIRLIAHRWRIPAQLLIGELQTSAA